MKKGNGVPIFQDNSNAVLKISSGSFFTKLKTKTGELG
jgi:hypothetical protein